MDDYWSCIRVAVDPICAGLRGAHKWHPEEAMEEGAYVDEGAQSLQDWTERRRIETHTHTTFTHYNSVYN